MGIKTIIGDTLIGPVIARKNAPNLGMVSFYKKNCIGINEINNNRISNKVK
jgi:hypothetical protein